MIAKLRSVNSSMEGSARGTGTRARCIAQSDGRFAQYNRPKSVVHPAPDKRRVHRSSYIRLSQLQ